MKLRLKCITAIQHNYPTSLKALPDSRLPISGDFGLPEIISLSATELFEQKIRRYEF